MLLNSVSVLASKKSLPCLPGEFVCLLRLFSGVHNSLDHLSFRANLKLEQLRICPSLTLTLDFTWSFFDYPVPFWSHGGPPYLEEFAQFSFSSIFMSLSWCFTELPLSQILSQPCMIQTVIQSVICQRKSVLKRRYVNKKQFTYDSRCACAQRSLNQ